jgi:hypothetical protein
MRGVRCASCTPRLCNYERRVALRPDAERRGEGCILPLRAAGRGGTRRDEGGAHLSVPPPVPAPVTIRLAAASATAKGKCEPTEDAVAGVEGQYTQAARARSAACSGGTRGISRSGVFAYTRHENSQLPAPRHAMSYDDGDASAAARVRRDRIHLRYERMTQLGFTPTISTKGRPSEGRLNYRKRRSMRRSAYRIHGLCSRCQGPSAR